MADIVVTKYYPLMVNALDGSLVVLLHEDGTPEFGPGITAENVWPAIAAAIPYASAASPTPEPKNG